MSFESRLKKSIKRRKNKRGRRRSLMSTNAGPFVIIGIWLVGIALVIFLIFKFAVPKFFELTGWTWPIGKDDALEAEATPKPTPHPLNVIDFSELQKEISPSVRELYTKLKYISDPMYYDGNIILCGGTDPAVGPKNTDIYLLNATDSTYTHLDNIVLENDDFFYPQMSQNYIVWLDHKREGGGKIKAMIRSTKEIYLVKEYYVGKPTIKLSGNNLAWIERTGSYMDKAFLFDLSSQEAITLGMFESSPFGMSDIDISKEEVIWADYDTTQSSEDEQNLIASIHSAKLNEPNKKMDEFSTGTYVFNPMTNGNVRIWSDTNDSPASNLYMSKNKGAPVHVASEVSSYSLGSNFIIYCSKEQLFIYMIDGSVKSKLLTREGERCMLIGISNDTVFWYERGASDSGRDIVKYAEIFKYFQ